MYIRKINELGCVKWGGREEVKLEKPVKRVVAVRW